MKFSKVIIVSGNGCVDVTKANWYSDVQKKLSKALNVQVLLPQMPDPLVARESVWIPHILGLGCDERTLLIGHSSGAQAALRFAEKNPVGCIVLVSACHTDLGIENERASGYYSRPWLWDDIKKNCKTQIVQW